MPPQYRYIADKLHQAIESLIQSNQSRAAMVEVCRELVWLEDQNLSGVLGSELAKFLAVVTAERQEGAAPEDCVEATLISLPDERIAEISSLIIGLYGTAKACEGALRPPFYIDEQRGSPADFWEHLNWGGAKENFPEDYLAFARRHLPNFPEEVLREWIVRHDFGCVFEPWAWLGIDSLSFTFQSWPLASIRTIRGNEDQNPDWFVNQADSDDWLPEEMRATGTWPTPIIVLNPENIALEILRDRHQAVDSPILLEGHRRLSILGVLPNPQSEHTVVVATVDPERLRL